MKNIKLTKDEFITKLIDYLENNNFKYEVNYRQVNNANWQYNITIAGNKPFIYSIYETDKGLSVTPQGKNSEIADKILNIVVANVTTVKPKSQAFVGIIPDVYDNIRNFYSNIIDYSIEETKCSDVQINLSIVKNKQKVILQYYHTTQKIILTGQSTHLWDDVFFELTSNLNIKAKEIIEKYLTSKEEMQSLNISYDEGILDEYVKCLLGSELYTNENLITEFEKNWLKTSAFLVFTEIQLPEYFASIASAIKIIEGVLNRICIEYNLPQNTSFDYFEPNEQNTVWNLKSEYKVNFKNNQKIIQTVNALYNFIHNNRHKLFHNDGINPEQIIKKDTAVTIFQQIITLLKQVHENSII